MKFSKAIKITGESDYCRAYREGWPSGDAVRPRGSVLIFHSDEGHDVVYCPSYDDVVAKDWWTYAVERFRGGG